MIITEQKKSLETDTDLLQLSAYFVQAFPEMNKLEQQIALAIYRTLAKAKPVTTESIAKTVKHKQEAVDNIIHSWPGIFFNDDNGIIGFWGLTILEMPHRMTANENTVYTWCAWDALFIPELINKTTRVNSECPVTNKNIELQVSATKVSVINNQEIMVSFLKPDLDDFKNDVTTNFCHFVFFFSNREAGEQWCSEHPNTFLLSLQDAFTVGKHMNAARYNLTL